MSTFVGIGFGPIQAGLFLYEAARSGAFTRLVASEILPATVSAINNAGGYTVNIAHADHIEAAEVAPVTLYNPTLPDNYDVLVRAIAAATAIATALPSVAAFTGDAASAPHRLLAAGLTRKHQNGGPPAVIYAGENHNHAAELLREAVAAQLPAQDREAILARVVFVNTVIGKMSGYAEVSQTGKQALARIAPGLERAFLVEEFSNILISPILFADHAAQQQFKPGITRFVAKPDLFPFEEAKLYVHNAMHAFAAYLGKIAGCTGMAQLRHVPGILSLVRSAALEEPGRALVAKYAGVDPLFTEAGMQAYVDDLIARMVNPLLNDEISRVARDPARKLGWEDRLIGAMRLALAQGIQPHRFALGAAAALADLVDAESGKTGPFPWGQLIKLWQRPDEDAAQAKAIERMIASAWTHIEAFRDASSDTPVAPSQGASAQGVTAQPGSNGNSLEAQSTDAPMLQNAASVQPAEKHWGQDAPLNYAHE